MIKTTNSTINSKLVRSIVSDTVNIDAGSVVFDNRWISYNSINYDISDYITSVVVPPRTRFFNNRNYSLTIVVGLDRTGSIKTVEGSQVLFSSNNNVPLPTTINIIPLVGIVLVQDGTADLNSFRDVSNKDIISFSGMGNIKNKNLIGNIGEPGVLAGERGVTGVAGIIGARGITGPVGDRGHTGLEGVKVRGETGLPGSTGISWDINIPFKVFI
jgi:hypothetical protein